MQVCKRDFERARKEWRVNQSYFQIQNSNVFDILSRAANYVFMIARIWHGKTHVSNYETYTEFVKHVAIPDYKKTRGFVSLTFLRNIKNDEGHFVLVTYWENLEVIKNFAGQDLEKAKYYPEDDDFLLEFEEHVQHYEVFAS